MKPMTSKAAKKVIRENWEIIEDKQKAYKAETSRLAKNLISTQIENRKTIIKSLEKLVQDVPKTIQ